MLKRFKQKKSAPVNLGKNKQQIKTASTITTNGTATKGHCNVCGEEINPQYKLCYKHYKESQNVANLPQRNPNECPGCGNKKSPNYDLCISCTNLKEKGLTRGQIREAIAEHFYVYILKLNDGSFYAGQTRELRERLTEHKDGQVKTTCNRTPKLVWFDILRTRESAEKMEERIKGIIKRDPREIRRMVVAFKDLVDSLEFD